MSNDSGDKSRYYAASDSKTSADELRRLATDPDDRVRVGVAAHANAPPDALARLASDPDESVREAATGNLRGVDREPQVSPR